VLPVVREHADTVDREARFPEENLEALRGSGLLGLLVPTEYGGMGGTLVDLMEGAQLLAAECLSTAMIWAMHCQQVDPLVRYATPALRQHVLPRVGGGELYLASVTTEPGKGGHLLTNAAAARVQRDGLLLDRAAPIVTGGDVAGGFLITMRASEDAPESRVSLVYADRVQLRLERSGGWDTLGMRGTASVGLHLSGQVPRWQVVGEEGGFRAIALESLAPVGHLAWAACWLGAARSALGRLINLIRSKNRPASIDPRSDLVKERIARVRMDLELVSAYLHRVLDEVIAHRDAGCSLGSPSMQIHLNTLKVTAAELTFRAVDRMVQMAGVNLGYRRDTATPLERAFRDLRSASLNYANDRLLTASGALTVMDQAVRLA
jgi:acyl-CoA dehydrogenase